MSEIKDRVSEYLTVSALTHYIKRKFEQDPYLDKVWLVGEISNFRLRPNSHQYFSLKDNHARISAVMYRPAFAKLPFKIEEGMKVIVSGRVSLYEPSGTYQLIIESMEPDGVGALYLALEQVKQKFKTAGLLDLPRQPIPTFPKRIAVITSPSGAVIRDIMTTIRRRYPIVQVTIFPTRVQGKEAKQEIVTAFQQVGQYVTEFDTVILARGGGSIEDLWCFNEEEVAQAILACQLPVITAIGHETDTTLADLVADVRAATPTAAAEIAVPVLRDIQAFLQERQAYLYRLINQKLQTMRKQLEKVSQAYVLRQPERLYQAYYQQVDQLFEKLKIYQTTYFRHKQQELKLLQQKLQHTKPQQQVKEFQLQLQQMRQRLIQTMGQKLKQDHLTLSKQIGILDAYSPLKIMVRGYAMVEDGDTLVTSVGQVQLNHPIKINLTDGVLTAQVTDIKRQQMKEELEDGN